MPNSPCPARGTKAARHRSAPRIERRIEAAASSSVAGTGVHTVDFVDWPLTAGQMLFVRPGQVQQWHTTGDFEAHLILIDPSALPPHPFPLDEWKTCPKGLFLQGEPRDMMQRSVEQLRHDFDQFSGDPLDILLLRYQLMVLLTRFARLQQRPPDAPPPTSRTAQLELVPA